MVGAGTEEEGKQTAGGDKTASKYFTCFPSPLLAANTPLSIMGCPCPVSNTLVHREGDCPSQAPASPGCRKFGLFAPPVGFEECL